MPISVTWHNINQTIIKMTFDGLWDVADFIAAHDRSLKMMHQVSHCQTIHMMLDFKVSQATPRDLLSGFQYINRTLPPNQGIVVYINANSVIKAFVLMAKRAGLPATEFIYHADTLDDAYRLIDAKAYRVHSA